MPTPLRLKALLAVAIAAAPSLAHADVKLAAIFSSGMVLQRDAAVPVFGTANPGETVTIKLAGQTVTATADDKGEFVATLDNLQAPGPYELTAAGSSTVTLKDVLVGDVFLCSGQSNMAYPMSAYKDTHTPYEADIATANFPLIRQGLVGRNPSTDPLRTAKVTWATCTPDTVGTFTAAGFYFARELQPRVRVPIGLVHSSWGGTSAEAWTSLASIDTVPSFKARAQEQLANLAALPERIKAFPAAIAAWEAATGRADASPADPAPYAALNADPAGWTPSTLKSKWSKMGLPEGGIAWLRKEIDLPTPPTKDVRLDLGLVDEQYVSIYFNGEKLADSGSIPPDFYGRYVNATLPAGKFKPGKNVIAMRFRSHTGDRVAVNRSADAIGLKGLGIKGLDDSVLVKVEKPFAPLSRQQLADRPPVPKGNAQGTTSCLYNGMIHPLTPFKFKAVLWYQGEQDASRAYAYRTLLPLMISDWRKNFAQPELPFIVQQLPNWAAGNADDTAWAELREAQALTARNTPHTHLSVGLDLGETGDVHPRNKRDIGIRLAHVALANVYGQPGIQWHGPLLTSATFTGKTATLTFSTTGNLKTTDGKTPARFTLAGKDQKFHPATATLSGQTITLTSPEVPEPVAARYAYTNSPDGHNLTDDTNLPAMPFRTDTFPASTDKRP